MLGVWSFEDRRRYRDDFLPTATGFPAQSGFEVSLRDAPDADCAAKMVSMREPGSVGLFDDVQMSP